MTKVTFNKDRLNYIITESIKKCVLNLNEGTPQQDMDTYNRLNQKIKDSDDPFYQERAKRTRNKLARHVQNKYDLNDDVYNKVYPDKESWYSTGASKPMYQHANNKQLKGFSMMKKNNMPYHVDELNPASRVNVFSNDGTFTSHLSEDRINQIVAESVKKVLHSINEGRIVNNKPLDNPDSDFNRESIGKHLERSWNKRPEYNFPCLPNLNTKVVEYVKAKYPNEILPYDREDDDRYYVEALLNLGFKRDIRHRRQAGVRDRHPRPSGPLCRIYPARREPV
jgi:hypothetical protein